MPTSTAAFEEDTAFERLVLDRATPLLPASPDHRSVIDLRRPGSTSVAAAAGTASVTVNVFATDSLGSSTAPITADMLRPLIFGAAWKVLDLLVELGLQQRRYRIEEKQAEAVGGRVAPVRPFDTRPDVWLPTMHLYAATTSLRHSLVHRRLKVDSATGRIEATARENEPAAGPLEASEQTAFCQVVQGVAAGAIGGRLTTRQWDQLGWALDRLATQHGQAQLGTSRVYGLIPLVQATAVATSASTVAADFDDISKRARQAVGGVSHYDLELHLPDGRVLAGALEDAPKGQADLSVESPPPWLCWR